MFESTMVPVTTAELETWVSRLAAMDRDVDDAARIDQVTMLERLKGAAAAAQARVSVDFDASQRESQAAAGLPARKRGAGIGAQIALARRDSPARGGRHLGLAKALVTEMPHTLRVLARGETTEWRATVLVRETATLSPEHRGEVDRCLADRLPGMGDREVEQAARVWPTSSTLLPLCGGSVAPRPTAESASARHPTRWRGSPGSCRWLRGSPSGRLCRPRREAPAPRGTSAPATRSWPTPSWSG
jgi:hypothetical protein